MQPFHDRMGAKLSFIRWNAKAAIGAPTQACPSRAFQIASLSNKELACLMKTCPAPDVHMLQGQWRGINKGMGAAFAGLTQDVKSFHDHGDCVGGNNIMVHQVAIRDLPCRGWQPIRDSKTCQPKTIGNFIAVSSSRCTQGHTTRLDYTIAENPWYDPSRFLIDELVLVDDDLLLGRANAKVGFMEFPVAYFVLFRSSE